MKIKYLKDHETISFAAEELERYLNKLSNINDILDKEFVFSLEINKSMDKYGLKDVEDLEKDDQYYINVKEDSGHIVANNPRSILLGVYKYLYLIGFRFLRPGDEYTLIPDVKKDDLMVQYKGEADFRHRGICIEGANSEENALELIDWLPKLGFNSFFVQFKTPYAFFERWYNHENNHQLEEEGFNLEWAKEISRKLTREMDKRSLLHHRVGHGWTSDIVGQSGVGWIKSNEVLDDDRKEYLALIDGKREFFGGIPTNTNLCYSNKEVIEKMSEDIVSYAHENPEIDYLHVWLADEYNNICECSQCKKTTPTDQYIRILNLVDEKMTENNIDTKIVFLLYQELLWPPIKEAYNNPERFIIMFAPISRTFEDSYGNLGSIPEIPEYDRNNVTLPLIVEENIAFLREWQKKFTGDGFVYDYPLGRAHYGDLGYVSISEIINEDVKHISSLGLNGYISCQELRAFLPNSLPNYTMGLSLFDSQLKFEEICQDYFESAYGKYGEEVYDYLNEISKNSSPDYFNGNGPRKNLEIANKFIKIKDIVENFLPRINEQINETEGVQNLFWKHLKYHGEYSSLLSKALVELAQGKEDKAKDSWGEFTDFIQKNELNYQEALDVYRVIEVATKYTGM